MSHSRPRSVGQRSRSHFKVKVSNITHLYVIFVQSISLYSIKGFSNNYAEIFTSKRRSVAHNNQVCLPKVKVTLQGRTFNIDSVKADAFPSKTLLIIKGFSIKVEMLTLMRRECRAQEPGL